MVKTKRYWGTQRVARVCQVSPATVANWIDQGLLKGHKTPTGRRRVESDDLAAFLRAHSMAVPAELERSHGREVVVVVEDDEGYRRALALTIAKSDLPVEVVAAPGEGDDTIADLAGRLPGRRFVVTADRELRRRCEAAGAAVTGPRWLTELLAQSAQRV